MAMDILESVEKRKSIRAFKPDPVPQPILQEIMERSLRAPSWGNTQPWDLIVVAGSKLEEIKQGFTAKAGQDTNPDIARPQEFPEPYASRRRPMVRPPQAAPGGQQQPPPPSEGEIAFRPDAEPRGQWDTRVGHVRDLMANQDTFTWAIVAISFAVQGGLFGIYFQGADPSGHLALPLAGLAAAFVFLLFVARSNWYMTTYMRLLRGTHREEYQIRAPHFPWSATSVMYGAHSVLALTWLVLLVSYLCACP